MIYDIKGEKRSTASVQSIIDSLRVEISREKAHIVRVTESTIEFESEIILFQTPWNIFNPVSCGIISVEQRDGTSMILYRISLFRVRVLSTIFTIFGLIAALVLIPTGEIDVVIDVFSKALIVGWFWLYGVIYIITRERLNTFFKAILDKLVTESPSISEKIEGVQQGSAKGSPGHSAFEHSGKNTH
jgi:hypothetical protein